MDRYFELMQAQHVQLRGEVQEVRTLLIGLTARVDRIEERLTGVEERLTGLETEVLSLRDWATREFADVRNEIRLLRQATEERDESLRRDIDALDARVTRLEQRRDDTVG
jgi:chromosome segregation ATPase